MKKTVIVVPCYNEEKRLDTQAFIDCAAKDEGVYFIFVNDGSTDGTIGKLRRIKDSCPSRVLIEDLVRNSGKAEAVRMGFLKAFGMDPDNIGYWDADLATPLDAIERFCRLLDTSDVTIVLGSRVKLLGRTIERQAMRHYVGRVFATVASLILELPVYDTQCGAKIFKNTEELKTVFGRPFRVSWTFDVEVLARFRVIEMARGVSLSPFWVEYPLEQWRDIKGSKLRYTDFLRAAAEVFRLFTFLHLPGVKDRYARYLFG